MCSTSQGLVLADLKEQPWSTALEWRQGGDTASCGGGHVGKITSLVLLVPFLSQLWQTEAAVPLAAV